MGDLIGREEETALLLELLGTPGRGLILVAGEAGIGKSRLVAETLTRSGRPVLRGEATPDATVPYGPLIHVVRSYARSDPDALRGLLLAKHLALLLPELGVPAATSDPATLTAAICDVAEAAGRTGTIVLLEDLQWADGATLDVLLELSKVPERCELSLVGTYRKDELSRLHRLRGVRSELRRVGRLHEIVLGPLERDEADGLAEEIAGRELSEDARGTIFARSDGIPFFIEELAASLREPSPSGHPDARRDDPPETLRDAIRVRTSSLQKGLSEVLETMTAAGVSVDLSLLAELVDPDAVTALIEHGWLVQVDGRTVSFRHALVRDAIYIDIPWLRRRERHRFLADELEARGAPPEEIAHQWLSARDPLRARPHLLRAARAFVSIHAYRDARDLLAIALEAWSEDDAPDDRLDAAELLARCTELCAETAEAADLWRQVATGRDGVKDAQGAARARRGLAALLEMREEWDGAIEARLAAAQGFDASAQPVEAAVERLAAAAHLKSAGDSTTALALVEQVAAVPEVAREHDLRVRTLALEGAIRAALGQPAGASMVREALELALAGESPVSAAEAYYRLATALEHQTRYGEAVEAYRTAFDFCRSRGIDDMGQVCFACLAPVLRHSGRWKEATEVCRSMLALPDAPPIARNVAAGELGLIHAIKGNVASARRLLTPALGFGRANEVFALVVECSWGTAMIQALDGDDEAASHTARELIEACRRRDERHYSTAAMRWCASWFAGRRDEPGLLSAVEVLSATASGEGSREARAALTHGLMEVALLHGEIEQAVEHAQRAARMAEDLGAPYEVAEIRAGCGAALAAGGLREPAFGLLTAAYRSAKKLGARPLAQRIVARFEALGEPVEPHLGRLAVDRDRRGGLSPREIDVLRYVAEGRTNREIGEILFLSTRTVDMHVRNVLMKLGCRTRAEAVGRAGELGILAPEPEAVEARPPEPR